MTGSSGSEEARADASQDVRHLEAAAKSAFGREGAADLPARLGPADAQRAAIPYCYRSTAGDYCSNGDCTTSSFCWTVPDDCGLFLAYDCNGLCE